MEQTCGQGCCKRERTFCYDDGEIVDLSPVSVSTVGEGITCKKINFNCPGNLDPDCDLNCNRI